MSHKTVTETAHPENTTEQPVNSPNQPKNIKYGTVVIIPSDWPKILKYDMLGYSQEEIADAVNRDNGYPVNGSTKDRITRDQIQGFLTSDRYQKEYDKLMKKQKSKEIPDEYTDIRRMLNRNKRMADLAAGKLFKTIETMNDNELKEHMSELVKIVRSADSLQSDIYKHHDNLKLKQREVEVIENDSSAVSAFLESIKEEDQE